MNFECLKIKSFYVWSFPITMMLHTFIVDELTCIQLDRIGTVLESIRDSSELVMHLAIFEDELCRNTA
jgi:hypothetical protein